MKIVIVPGNGGGSVESSVWYAWVRDALLADGGVDDVVLRDMPDPYLARCLLANATGCRSCEMSSSVIGRRSSSDTVPVLLPRCAMPNSVQSLVSYSSRRILPTSTTKLSGRVATSRGRGRGILYAETRSLSSSSAQRMIRICRGMNREQWPTHSEPICDSSPAADISLRTHFLKSFWPSRNWWTFANETKLQLSTTSLL